MDGYFNTFAPLKQVVRVFPFSFPFPFVPAEVILVLTRTWPVEFQRIRSSFGMQLLHAKLAFGQSTLSNRCLALFVHVQ